MQENGASDPSLSWPPPHLRPARPPCHLQAGGVPEGGPSPQCREARGRKVTPSGFPPGSPGRLGCAASISSWYLATVPSVHPTFRLNLPGTGG